MGSKKKKGGGRRSKGRASSKDHSSHDEDDNELLSEEITALGAIFQEDCKVDSGSPLQIIIKLRFFLFALYLIFREVATLSRLQHQHVVRYYQAWFEIGVDNSFGDSTWCTGTATSSTFGKGAGLTDVPGQDNKLESTYLYIQMEYCPRTLRQVFESYNHFDKELAWHLFRQIVEGLVHIHGQGIIHRDLTPNNIFFDARNDIKIGDFGLAKFLRLEQVDQDGGFPTDILGSSVDGTGQVGTYFYTAPKIEQRWPRIDEKVDMYSIGVVFFELWHPFGTAMERHIVLSDLKLKGELPSAWIAEFPEQASLLRCLMSQSPSDRPSAMELLQNVFPPKMEYELLDSK